VRVDPDPATARSAHAAPPVIDVGRVLPSAGCSGGTEAGVATGVDERAYWVLLSMVAGIGPARFGRLIERFGGAQAAWTAPPLELAEVGLDRRAVRSLLELRAKRDPEAEWRRLERLGVDVLTLEDAAYPPRLREIADPPPVLYVHGGLTLADEWAVAVVGTRRATAYGRQVAERVVGEVARAGVTIVSGLARGIDTFAHRAALAAGGRTLAVLGSGLDRLYPSENRALAAEIRAHGAIVSELPLGSTYTRRRLPSTWT
jgi:DNA processing protein